jgi:hypothetical protein
VYPWSTRGTPYSRGGRTSFAGVWSATPALLAGESPTMMFQRGHLALQHGQDSNFFAVILPGKFLGRQGSIPARRHRTVRSDPGPESRALAQGETKTGRFLARIFSAMNLQFATCSTYRKANIDGCKAETSDDGKIKIYLLITVYLARIFFRNIQQRLKTKHKIFSERKID